MCITFLQILLIFSSPEGYRYNFPVHVHILCILYDTVLANTAVLSAYTCHLFAGLWCPLVSVITTLHYTMLHVRMLFQ